MFQMDDVGKPTGPQVGAKRTRHGDKKETDSNNNTNIFSPLAAIDLTSKSVFLVMSFVLILMFRCCQVVRR